MTFRSLNQRCQPRKTQGLRHDQPKSYNSLVTLCFFERLHSETLPTAAANVQNVREEQCNERKR